MLYEVITLGDVEPVVVAVVVPLERAVHEPCRVDVLLVDHAAREGQVGLLEADESGPRLGRLEPGQARLVDVAARGRAAYGQCVASYNFV